MNMAFTQLLVNKSTHLPSNTRYKYNDMRRWRREFPNGKSEAIQPKLLATVLSHHNCVLCTLYHLDADSW